LCPFVRNLSLSTGSLTMIFGASSFIFTGFFFDQRRFAAKKRFHAASVFRAAILILSSLQLEAGWLATQNWLQAAWLASEDRTSIGIFTNFFFNMRWNATEHWFHAASEFRAAILIFAGFSFETWGFAAENWLQAAWLASEDGTSLFIGANFFFNGGWMAAKQRFFAASECWAAILIFSRLSLNAGWLATQNWLDATRRSSKALNQKGARAN